MLVCLSRLMLILVLSSTVAGCKGKAKSPTTTSIPTAKAGAVAKNTSGLIGGKLVIQDTSVGDAKNLVVWLFGPLGSDSGATLGQASGVDVTGGFSFQNVTPGSYHLQVGHTWASPKSTSSADGFALRQLSSALKLASSNAGTKDVLAIPEAVTIKVDDTTSVLGTVTITGDDQANTWSPQSYLHTGGSWLSVAQTKPTDGDYDAGEGAELPKRSTVQIEAEPPAGAQSMDLVVKEGDTQIYTEHSLVGEFQWHGAHEGSFSYQLTANMRSSKKLTTSVFHFSVKGG